MAEIFGATAGALSVAALFNNCVCCFEYIQLGRQFAQDYEKCQLKIDIARTRLSRWGKAVAIDEDPRFATDEPEDESVQQVQEILEEISQLFENLENASKRYMKRSKEKKDLEPLPTQAMRPVAQKMHSRLSSIVRQRQKSTSFLKKTAWALYDAKNFEKLGKDIAGFVDALEKLFPANEGVRRTLAATEVRGVDDEPSLRVLHDAAVDTDGLLGQAVAEKLEVYGSRNSVKDLLTEENARLRIGNEYTQAILSSSRNEAGSVKARGSSMTHIGNSYGGRGTFDN